MSKIFELLFSVKKITGHTKQADGTHAARQFDMPDLRV